MNGAVVTADYLNPPGDFGCCALDDAAGTGHDGPCAWVCSWCDGSATCWLCNGYAAGDDCDWCEGCDGTGSCFYCYDGMEVDDV